MSAFARVRRAAGGLYSAMVFKELTQGVRSNAYLSLFAMLLGFGWLTILLFWYFGEAADEGGALGAASALTLVILLGIYALIVGARAHLLTIKEIENHTFELYLLAGMSPERLVRGKVVTCLYQFLFGFATVVPFIFCSYFLRGLDFRLLLILLALLLLGAVAWYHFSIFAALARMLTPLKTTITLAYFGSLAFISVFVVPVVFFTAGNQSEAFVRAWEAFFRFDGELPLRLVAFVFVYVLPLLVFSTFSSHVICPDADSREDRVKALALAGLLILAVLGIADGGTDAIENTGLRMAVATVGLALLGWVHRDTMQVMPAIGLLSGSRRRRLWLFFFAPGRAASARLLLLVYLACAAVPPVFLALGELPRDRLEPAMVAWLSPAAFFAHLWAWDALARRVPALRADHGRRRLALLLAWGIAAALVSAPNVHRGYGSPWWTDVPGATLLLGQFFSPFMTIIVHGSTEVAGRLPAMAFLAVVGAAIAARDAWSLDPIPPRVRGALAAPAPISWAPVPLGDEVAAAPAAADGADA